MHVTQRCGAGYAPPLGRSSKSWVRTTGRKSAWRSSRRYALPPDQREVLHLHAFEGMTFQEIADLAGESINTISSRYRYAMGKLRQTLT
jgi:RNA polymerase sigma factor (sigma-70 family)